LAESIVKGPWKTGPWGFQVIGFFKLTGAVFLTAAGVGIFRLLNKDLGTTLEYYILRFRLDPENRLIHTLISRVSGIDHHQLKLIGVGTFFYAFLHVVEGTGLLLRRRWAGYVTVIITGSLLPVEVYEILRHANWMKALVLLVNLGILVYLIAKLKEETSAANTNWCIRQEN